MRSHFLQDYAAVSCVLQRLIRLRGLGNYLLIKAVAQLESDFRQVVLAIWQK
ncbi:hypothetical protein [Aliterella atlantica]|uniref:hypothetical protein n=1 Tax=Aliterella atlantica TaxID=1827278 RepID=UPI0013649995